MTCSSIISGTFGCVKNAVIAPFSKEFWKNLPANICGTAAKVASFAKDSFANTFTVWTKAGRGISDTLFKFVFPYHPYSKGETTKAVDPSNTVAGKFMESFLAGYRKDQDPTLNVKKTQIHKKRAYDPADYITDNASAFVNRIIIPKYASETGPVWKGLLTTVVAQEFLFGLGDNTIEDVPYYITMSATGEILVFAADTAMEAIGNEIPILKLPFYFINPKFLFEAMATHPEIKKAIEEQPFIKYVNGHIGFAIKSVSEKLSEVGEGLSKFGSVIRKPIQRTLVDLVHGALEAAANAPVVKDPNGNMQTPLEMVGQKSYEMEQKLQESWYGIAVVYIAKAGAKPLGDLASNVKEEALTTTANLIVDQGFKVGKYATKTAVKYTALTYLANYGMKNHPLFGTISFMMQGGTRQSTGELFTRIGVVGTMAMDYFLPPYISIPIKSAVMITMTGGPGSSMKDCARIGGIFAATVISLPLLGAPLVTVITMLGTNFLLNSRKETLEIQGINETSFIEDIASFAKDSGKKMNNFWAGVGTKKATLMSADTKKEDGTDKTSGIPNSENISSWNKPFAIFFSVVWEFTEEMYSMPDFTPPKEKME